jgi:acetyltransferase EpsM
MAEEVKYWIYGASGHGKVVLDCLLANDILVKGFIDDDSQKKRLNDLPVFNRSYIRPEMDKVVFGIGENNIRKHLAEILKYNYLTVIHPSAAISPFVQIGQGTVIFHNTVVQSGTIVGNHCILNTKASIDHDCVIGDFAHISPGAILCGNVTIGESSWIGAGSVIIQGIKVGKNALIGAGSVVIRDVPDNSVIVGNPGRVIKLNQKIV